MGIARLRFGVRRYKAKLRFQFSRASQAKMSTQNMDSNPQAAFPSLCSNGCGFFSTTDKEGLCSVCFKEKLKKEAESQPQGPPTTSSSTQTPPPPPPSERPSGSSSPSVTSQ